MNITVIVISSVIAISELISLSYIESIWRADKIVAKKIGWSLLLLIPLLGPPIYLLSKGKTHVSPVGEIQLPGLPNLEINSGKDGRVDFLKTLLNNAEVKVNHIDGIRQRNMAVAIAIFAGVFGIAVRPSDCVNTPLAFAFLSLLMTAFCLLDRTLHRFSHGWRSTGARFFREIQKIIADPAKSAECERYNQLAERRAEYFSLIPIIYYLLIIVGGSAVVAIIDF